MIRKIQFFCPQFFVASLFPHLTHKINFTWESIAEKEERSSNFGEFLRSHINLVRQDEERRRYLYEVSFFIKIFS